MEASGISPNRWTRDSTPSPSSAPTGAAARRKKKFPSWCRNNFWGERRLLFCADRRIQRQWVARMVSARGDPTEQDALRRGNAVMNKNGYNLRAVFSLFSSDLALDWG